MLKEIKSQDYSVFIGDDVLQQVQSFLEEHAAQYTKFFILVDENTVEHCLPIVQFHVPFLKDAEIVEIESGEQNKCIEVVTQVWITLSEAEADRQALFVNLGGGVIGDMGGFIASTYKRGIDFINIPTTLLSQVDASVGGKLGIDLNGLKNQIGVFAYPKGVFILPSFLETLPKGQVRSGFAEVLKHALIRDQKHWDLVKKITLKKKIDFEDIIYWSVNIKNNIVLQDPREKGLRKLLNFGHTIGHAVETLSIDNPALSELMHGEAIAVGMIAELYLSQSLAGLSLQQAEEIESILVKLYQPTPLREDFFDAYLHLMMQDKKNDKGAINFTLLKAIGDGEVNYTANKKQIVAALKYYNSVIARA